MGKINIQFDHVHDTDLFSIDRRKKFLHGLNLARFAVAGRLLWSRKQRVCAGLKLNRD